MAINEYPDDSCELFATPNSTLLRDEEFRTPLNELPSNTIVEGLVYAPQQSFSPTYYSVASSGSSPNGSHASQTCGSGSGSNSDEDSGLDENYHTPRVSKIKSMENLSLLEMEFHKASQELDRNSPRRLKKIIEPDLPKMKSLNNLCFDNYTDSELMQEFSRMRESSMLEKQRFQYTPNKQPNEKIFVKHKVGNAKFIGADDTPDIYRKHRNPYSMHKIRSLGTIPDVVGERVAADPFLTPTSGRKPQFPFITQSAEKATPTTREADVVDGHIVRSPFERAYKRSAIKSSTPFRQSIGYIQHQAAHDNNLLKQQQQVLLQVEPTLRRPHSTNAAYDLMRFVLFIHAQLKKTKSNNVCLTVKLSTIFRTQIKSHYAKKKINLKKC